MNITLVDLSPRSLLFRAPSWVILYQASVAAALRHGGHAVQLLEYRSLPERPADTMERIASRLEALLRAFVPALVLFRLRLDMWPALGPMAAAARTAAPSATILAGGRHPSMCPDETLQYCRPLDGVVVGEPEKTMRLLADGGPLENVPALVLRRDAAPLHTGGSPAINNLDDIPPPAWDLLDMDFHTRRTPRVIPCFSLRTATVESSRGCGGQCSFCVEGRLHVKRHRYHSARYMREILAPLVARYGIEGVYFSDETFLDHPPRVVELCEELLCSGLAPKLAWTAQVRADTIEAGFLPLMRRAGCVQLELGIESGSQRMLDAVSKGTTVEQNERALRLLRQAGIRSLAYMMYNLPGETEDDIRQTDRFLRRTRPDIVRLNSFIVYPGSPAAAQLIERGLLDPDFWIRGNRPPLHACSHIHLAGEPLETLRKARHDLYMRHVFSRFVLDYLRHNPPHRILTQFERNKLWPFLLRKVTSLDRRGTL